jgi:hypothetical protein
MFFHTCEGVQLDFRHSCSESEVVEGPGLPLLPIPAGNLRGLVETVRAQVGPRKPRRLDHLLRKARGEFYLSGGKTERSPHLSFGSSEGALPGDLQHRLRRGWFNHKMAKAIPV